MIIISKILYVAYRVRNLRCLALSLVKKIEGDEFYSPTLRKIFKDYHNIDIGMYSYGCFNVSTIGPKTMIGRYCSFAAGVSILHANHPLTHKSLHPFFYNPCFEYVNDLKIIRSPIIIGHDVWIGQNAIITPSVNRIGNGVAIGAGSVVTKDIPDFAVVVGNPARVIKYRFDQETIIQLNHSQWWLKDIKELIKNMDDFIQPFHSSATDDISIHTK
jgi:acetyltransferase-like isoleucine patch superfamily enzyme